jgi:hypothetical protein
MPHSITFVRLVERVNYIVGRGAMYLLFVLAGVLLWSIIAKAAGRRRFGRRRWRSSPWWPISSWAAPIRCNWAPMCGWICCTAAGRCAPRPPSMP